MKTNFNGSNSTEPMKFENKKNVMGTEGKNQLSLAFFTKRVAKLTSFSSPFSICSFMICE